LPHADREDGEGKRGSTLRVKGRCRSGDDGMLSAESKMFRQREHTRGQGERTRKGTQQVRKSKREKKVTKNVREEEEGGERRRRKREEKEGGGRRRKKKNKRRRRKKNKGEGRRKKEEMVNTRHWQMVFFNLPPMAPLRLFTDLRHCRLHTLSTTSLH
jgi:hypothetical protein